MVHTDDPAFARDKLTAPVQNKIASLFKTAHGELILKDQYLWHVFGNEIAKDADRHKIAATHQELVGLAGML